MFEWYPAVCNAYTACTGSMVIETVIGTKTSIESYTPWCLSIGNKGLRPENPDYSKELAITWCDKWGNSTGEEVTPESLSNTCKPVKATMSPQEWAFKVGTLCSPNTTAPDWNALAEHKGHRWLAKACRPTQVSSWVTVEDLDSYYKLGTMCKWGTPYSQVTVSESKLHLIGPGIVNNKGAGRCRHQ
jgi:hypothetical protein